MKWPWVSRERFEDLEKRFEEVDAERKGLLRDLLEREPAKPPVSVEEDRAETFATPFDRIERRFSQTFNGKTPPPQFKVRVR